MEGERAGGSSDSTSPASLLSSGEGGVVSCSSSLGEDSGEEEVSRQRRIMGRLLKWSGGCLVGRSTTAIQPGWVAGGCGGRVCAEPGGGAGGGAGLGSAGLLPRLQPPVLRSGLHAADPPPGHCGRAGQLPLQVAVLAGAAQLSSLQPCKLEGRAGPQQEPLQRNAGGLALCSPAVLTVTVLQAELVDRLADPSLDPSLNNPLSQEETSPWHQVQLVTSLWY